MIKIKLTINNKYSNVLSEDLIKYSENAHKEIIAYVMNAIQNNIFNDKTIIKVPLKDVLYTNNENFDLGLPFLYYANIKNSVLPNEDIIKYWNKKQKKFDKSFLESIKNDSFDLIVRIDSNTKTKALASMGAATSANKTVFVMSFFIQNIKNIDSIENFTRHELQHLTEKINNTCIRYAEKLKTTYNPEKIKLLKINLKSTKYMKFGLGKQKTGIKKTKSSDLKKKIGSDIEYEPYLSDLVHGYFKKIKHLLSLETGDSNKIATKYTKLFFDNYRYQEQYKNYNLIADILLKKRPKEFPKDFLLSLEKMIS
jgi:hypothetical protein